MSFQAKPYQLQNAIQTYQWGTRGDEAFIPKLLGMSAEPGTPYAELWMGAHPKAPSQITIDGEQMPLNNALEQYTIDILGKELSERIGSAFPFLFKVLSAGEALSIQVHPNKKQAKHLHSKDPEHYPDDNHKPEIAIALDSLSALAGFLTLEEMTAVFETYPEINEFIGKNIIDEALKENIHEAQAVRVIFERMMKKATQEPGALAKTVASLKQRIEKKETTTEKESLFLTLQNTYGADPGLLCLFIFNLIHLNAGEAFYTGAGIPHAYLKGNIIECMANSDNVVRAGLTPKFKDVDTLVDILTYETGQPDIIKPNTEYTVFTYQTPAPEFLVKRILLQKAETLSLTSKSSPSIVIVIEGEISCSYTDGSTLYKKGDAFLVPAAVGSYNISAISDALIFEATIP